MSDPVVTPEGSDSLPGADSGSTPDSGASNPPVLIDDLSFEVLLTAKTTDEGGLKASFERQLTEFGGTATLVSTFGPYRVDGSNGPYFEVQRTYNIVL